MNTQAREELRQYRNNDPRVAIRKAINHIAATIPRDLNAACKEEHGISRGVIHELQQFTNGQLIFIPNYDNQFYELESDIQRLKDGR